MPEGVTVYNFTVDGNHNYFVIAAGDEFGQTCVLVHNQNQDPWYRRWWRNISEWAWPVATNAVPTPIGLPAGLADPPAVRGTINIVGNNAAIIRAAEGDLDGAIEIINQLRNNRPLQ
jgi:hypothetical protein